ncbi:MAG: phosphotransferase [Pirellulales bacterium]
MDQDLQFVLSEYAEADGGCVIAPVGAAGGFSDARVWRVTTPAGDWAVRRWPVGQPTAPRRAFLHRFLRYLYDRGLTWIAAPLRTRHGTTFVERAGRTWEVAPWLPGAPDFSPSVRPEKVAAALEALAKFHQYAAPFPPGPARNQAPGLVDRHAYLRLLVQGDLERLRRAVADAAKLGRHSDSLLHKSIQILDLFEQAAPQVATELTGRLMTMVPVMPCLRDVWREHVLFEGEQVSGIIDYGALRTDCVAADLSRLLGSYHADDRSGWDAGLAAYERVRPLTDDERSLVAVYDRSSVLLSGTYWIRWIFVDGIEFPDLQKVELRMDEWLARLRHLAGSLPGGLHFSMPIAEV